MNNQALVRRADRRDLGAIVELVVGLRDSLQRARPTRSEFLRRLERLVQDPAVTLAVAVYERAVVGYALQRRHFSLWAAGGAAVLEELFVAKAARGRGLGRRLVEHAIRNAREAGCEGLALEANERDAVAIALYEDLGFTCARARWEGGRQIRYDLCLAPAQPVETGLRWGPWMVKW